MSLTVLMYHYVRDSKSTPFKNIKGVGESDFIRQVKIAKSNFTVVDIDQALDYLSGDLITDKNLVCL